MDIPFFQFFYKKSNSSPTYRKPTTSCYLFVKIPKYFTTGLFLYADKTI